MIAVHAVQVSIVQVASVPFGSNGRVPAARSIGFGNGYHVFGGRSSSHLVDGRRAPRLRLPRAPSRASHSALDQIADTSIGECVVDLFAGPAPRHDAIVRSRRSCWETIGGQ